MRFNILKYLGFLIVFLVLIIPAKASCRTLSDVIDLNIFTDPDTVSMIVYDTIFTYDTVFEYVEVMETVVVYDTVTIYQMPLIGRPDTLFFVPDNNSVLPVKPLLEEYSPVWKSGLKAASSTNTPHRKKWFSRQSNPFDNLNNPVPFGYGIASKSSISLEASAYLPYSIVEANNQEALNRVESKFTPSLSWRQTIRYRHSFDKLHLSAGLGVDQLNYNLDVVENSIRIDTLNQWNYFQREIVLYDTTWFINMDSLLVGDTVWVPYVETTTQYLNDSTITQKLDTTYQTKNTKNLNHYISLQIPFSVSYTLFSNNRFFVDVTGGATAGLLLHTSGKIISPETGEIIDVEGFNNIDSWNFSLYGGSRVTWKITPLFSMYLSGGYCYGLSYFLTGNYYRVKHNDLSFSLGVSYRIYSAY